MLCVLKTYAISKGVALIGDVIEVNSPNEHMIAIDGKLPLACILTRGRTPACICATDLPFSRRKPHTTVEDFTALYKSPDGSPVEFWKIAVRKGKKAILKTLSIGDARKLFEKLPQKLVSESYLFTPDAVKWDQRECQRANKTSSDFKQSERERLGPTEPKRSLSLGQSLDPHELLK